MVNIALVIAASAFIWILCQHYFVDLRTPEPINAGSPFQLVDIDWTENTRTLVIVLKKDCGFCPDSAGFYQRILQSAREKRIGTVAVLPTDLDQSLEYLKALRLDFGDVKQANYADIGVKGAPTILIVDQKGDVIKMWVGKLGQEAENQVMEML